jgi:mannose-1-phosphate guanylyltransferase/mannose-6-phosphate isomerase
LWPVSQPLRPKQLLSLVTSRTLLQDTLLRTRGLGPRVAAPIVICNEAHRFLVAEQLREIEAGAQAVVLEPQGRNTAPAAAVAALLALENAGSRDDPLLLVLPADHVILNEASFHAAVEAALAAASAGKLVTFGVVPAHPETGYGYIRRGEGAGGWFTVAEFVEKPDLKTAERYLASGEYLWNSGMFLFSARRYLEELERHAPAMLPASRAALAAAVEDADFLRLGEEFLESPSDSIDYAVMEKTHSAAVVPLDAGWSDVGSWAALHEILEKDGDGNVLRGKVLAEDCRGCYVSADRRVVGVIGLNGLVVIETPDAVLVVPRDRAQDVKRLTDRLSDDAQ